VDPGERPIADYVKEAKALIAKKISLPSGIRLGWAGQFKYFERAKKRLKLILPITLIVVCFLLFLNTGSLVQMGILILTVPFSLIGSIWFLFFLGYNMSVAVWVGLIALLGVAAETGVVMLLYLKLSYERWEKQGKLKTWTDLENSIVEGSAQRIRPKLMAVLTTFIGLMPLLWGSGTGADMMKRIAAPMIGGLFTSFFMELTVYPAIFAIWKGRQLFLNGKTRNLKQGNELNP